MSVWSRVQTTQGAERTPDGQSGESACVGCSSQHPGGNNTRRSNVTHEKMIFHLLHPNSRGYSDFRRATWARVPRAERVDSRHKEKKFVSLASHSAGRYAQGVCGCVAGECSDRSALCPQPADVGIDGLRVGNNETQFQNARLDSRLRPRATGTDMFVALDTLPHVAKQTAQFRPRVQGLKLRIATPTVLGSTHGGIHLDR